MRHLLLAYLTAAFSILTTAPLRAQTTAFTYQGQLYTNTVAASGSNDLRFVLFDDALAGTQISTNITVDDVVMTNGLFTVTLDWGTAAQFDGSDRWLEIRVRPGSAAGAFTTLSPRQKITSTPYAQRALNAGTAVTATNLTGNLAATQLTGTIADARLSSNVSLLGSSIESSEITDGTLVNADINSAAAITDTKLATLTTAGKVANSATTATSANTANAIVARDASGGFVAGDLSVQRLNAGNNHLLTGNLAGIGAGNGNTNQALRAFVAGGLNNWIQTNAGGSFLGAGQANLVSSNSASAFLGAGEANVVASDRGFIGAGQDNTIATNAGWAVIPGGRNNAVTADYGFAAGRRAKANQSGTFVWADAQNADFASTTSNTFLVRAQNGVGINTNNPQAALHVVGTVIASSFTGSGAGLTNLNSVFTTDLEAPRADIGAGHLLTGANASIGAGNNNTNQSTAAGIGGGVGNTVLTNSTGAFIAGGINALIGTNSYGSFIGGGTNNRIEGRAISATIGGGLGNNIVRSASLATIAGGQQNTNGGLLAFIGGGGLNRIGTNSTAATIGGGVYNEITPNTISAFIGGGNTNQVLAGADSAAIGGGDFNVVQGHHGTVPGGQFNTAGNYSLAAGYRALAVHDGTFVWSDPEATFFTSTAANQFLVRAQNGVGINTNNPQAALHVVGGVIASSFTGSGAGLTGLTSGAFAAGAVSSAALADGSVATNDLSGAVLTNTFWRLDGNAGTTAGTHFVGTTDLQPLVFKVNGQTAGRFEYATNRVDRSNSVNVIMGSGANFVSAGTFGATIAGGGAGMEFFSLAPSNAVFSDYGVIGGGYGNAIAAYGTPSTIAGGANNTIQQGADYAVIGGGGNNLIATNAGTTTIAGGYNNTVSNIRSTIGGGWNNSIEGEFGGSSTIAGGSQNKIEANAGSGAIGGGANNKVQSSASAAAIAGGSGNTVLTNGDYAMIPGGLNNSATNQAFAAGRRAKAVHSGAFVWGDDSNYDVSSTNANSVTFRASGGYRLFSNTNLTAGVSLPAGGTSWAVISDRNAKKDFAGINALAILEKLSALPITQWRYNWEDTATTPHIGPMAQDFKHAFYPGSDDKTITTLEADGVAFAAIQGLNQKLEQKETEIAELRARLEKLENFLHQPATPK